MTHCSACLERTSGAVVDENSRPDADVAHVRIGISTCVEDVSYTFSIILFLMILAAGLGSIASERSDVLRSRRILWLPVGIGAAVLAEMLLLQPVIDATVAWGLAGRTLIVALFVSPLAFGLGYCFPVGMRLVGHYSDALTA